MPSKGTPTFCFRLPTKQRRRLEETASIYGTEVSQFLRSLIGSILEADSIEARQFRDRLSHKLMTRQLAEAQMALPLAKEPRKRARKGKGAGTR